MIERRTSVQRPDPRAAAQSFINRNPLTAQKQPALSGSTTFLPGEGIVQRGRAGLSSARLSGVSEGTGRRVSAVTASAQRLRQIHEAGVAAKRAQSRTQSRTQDAQRMADQQVKLEEKQAYQNSQNSQNPKPNNWAQDGNLSASRNSLLRDASSYLGSRWVLGGRSYQGIDCSGLVMNVYNKLGFNITQHHAGIQGRTIPGVRTSVKNLKPGDIVAWKDGSHIAIYAGNGEIIEAANRRVGTVRRRLWASPSQVFGIAVRLPGE